MLFKCNQREVGWLTKYNTLILNIKLLHFLKYELQFVGLATIPY